MGLSRRIFTKEFKLAAVRRLEQGVSIGEAARALEVSLARTCCTVGGRSFAVALATCFRATGSSAGPRGALLSWSARSASRRWRLIF